MLRNRMTWMAAVLGTVALTGMVGCGKGQDSLTKGSVSINAANLLSTADVGSVSVTISGGITPSLVVPLVGNGTQYGALVSDLPVGTNYTFTASAKASDGTTELYHGAATNVSITKNATATVIINMNQDAATQPISNEAPVIDSLFASALLVSQNDTVTVKASAHDPDAGQTALMAWGWTATCGAVSLPTNTVGNDTTDGTSQITWTAPAADGVCTVNVTVTDANGVLKNVASVPITVNSASAAGNAKIIANLDTYPVITGLNATPVPLVKGQASTLTVLATDADGDTLNYHWALAANTDGSGTCTGTFGSATAATTTFTLDTTSTLAECTFNVVVDDGNFPNGQAKGGVVTNHLSLPVSGSGNTVVGSPVFGFDYQTKTSIRTGDTVGLAIVASQGCTGGTNSLVWTASDSTALTPTTPTALGLDPTLFTGAVTYTAQPGAEDGADVTVTVTATCSVSHQAISHTFTMVGANNVCNGATDGTDCTSAKAADKCVLNATCQAGSCHVNTTTTCSQNGVDQCQVKVCDSSDGVCKAQNKPDNTHCDDSNACTNNGVGYDICSGGSCTGAAKDCSGSVTDAQCQTATCDTVSGACSATPKANNTLCNDHNGCTGVSTGPGTSSSTPDSCQAGACTAGPAVTCPAGDVCQSASDSTYTCPIKVCLAPSRAIQTTPQINGAGAAADGTVWTGGALYGSYNFGAGLVTSSGSSDAYLNKVNPATLAVTQTFTFGFSGGGDQTANLVAAGQNGNVLVAGVYTTEIDFTDQSNSGLAEFDYLAKVSAVSGAPTNYWMVAGAASAMPFITPIKGHAVDLGNGAFLATASNPAINKAAICGKTTRQAVTVVAGTSYGYDNTKGTTAFQTGTLTPFGGQTDIVVGVVDLTTGTLDWGKEFGGAGDQQCESIAMDASGNVYIAGNYNGTLDFGGGHALATLANSGLNVPFAAKFNASGVCQAATAWGTGGVSDVYGIGVTGSGDVIIAGGLGVNANANFGGTVGTLTSAGLSDGFVVKLNSSLTVPASGNYWGFIFGDAGFNQAALSLALSSSGDVFLGGAFEGTLTHLGGASSAGNAALDGFTAQLSGTDGSVLCVQTFGDTDGNQSASIAFTSTSGTVTYAGNFSGSMTLGTGAGAITLSTPNAGTSYGYISRLVP